MGRPKRTPAARAKNTERDHSMRAVEEQFAEPPPYSSRPPSVRPSSAKDGHEPSPTASIPAFDDLDFTPSPLELPTAAECIAHLRLLHAFSKLRHDVGNQDGLFGIELGNSGDTDVSLNQEGDVHSRNDSHQPEGVHDQPVPGAGAGAEEKRAEELLAERIRDKRWTVFVTKAVDRFEQWWRTVPSHSSTFPWPIATTDFDVSNTNTPPSKFPILGEGMDMDMEYWLPPLDILMVWQAYMLNPRTYLEDCIRSTKHKMWRTSFPWKPVYNSIDSTTLCYSPPQAAVANFKQRNKIPWDVTGDDELKTVACPRCQHKLSVPWTQPTVLRGKESIESYLSHDTGFAGQDFQEICPECNLTITHEKLRVGKFIADVTLDRRPMPGTILNKEGMPQMTEKNKHISSHDPFFPRRVVDNLKEFAAATLRDNVEHLSIQVLKRKFENVMSSPTQVMQVNSKQHTTSFVAKQSKIAVRMMFSHYWDNSSGFGLDLVGAVIRQGGFVQKMRKIDWLHSPSAVQTMQRLIVKYHRFVRLISENPKKVAVPTLDVDLAWHTHQLTPKVYYSYTTSELKKFLNHDDKIPESSLHTSFQWTSAAYEKKYGQPYSECACWYCECTREPLRSSFTNRINPLSSSNACSVDKLGEKGLNLPKDAATGAHISSHNALNMDGSKIGAPNTIFWALQKRRELEELDLQYAKVCKRYQKSKKASDAPSRESDAYMYGAYGYPMYYPVSVPYYAEPTCDGDRYSSVGGSGGGGACAAGTCAASASLGACAGGAGTPGCKASCGGHGDADGGCGTCGGGDGGGCGGCGG
ncbi:hypothetical protein BDV95DRAFT_507594 [Massariosphaeria phaeospora]|uniref:Alpha-ketoglutarate-dependent sulfonate dioxygenase n=1 Tax=Massariosphaeria phaeospora TaxID=100035 RepID=A0A7C8M6T1_9PLEO|nr:hypothetical protein BDV95DRAFT_507594 [Massariosphaeria phaeospora]